MTQNLLDVTKECTPPHLAALVGVESDAERQEVVLLADILTSEVNSGYGNERFEVVSEVDGRKIRGLADLVRLVEAPSTRALRHLRPLGRLHGHGEPRGGGGGRSRVLERYGVAADRSPRLQAALAGPGGAGERAALTLARAGKRSRQPREQQPRPFEARRDRPPRAPGRRRREGTDATKTRRPSSRRSSSWTRTTGGRSTASATSTASASACSAHAAGYYAHEARCEEREGFEARALALWRLVVRCDPRQLEAHARIGWLLVSLGRLADARAHYQKAAEHLEGAGQPADAAILRQRLADLRDHVLVSPEAGRDRQDHPLGARRRPQPLRKTASTTTPPTSPPTAFRTAASSTTTASTSRPAPSSSTCWSACRVTSRAEGCWSRCAGRSRTTRPPPSTCAS